VSHTKADKTADCLGKTSRRRRVAFTHTNTFETCGALLGTSAH